MAKTTTGSRSRSSSTKFKTVDASQRLMDSMAIAIDNMIEEIKNVQGRMAGDADKKKKKGGKKAKKVAKK